MDDGILDSTDLTVMVVPAESAALGLAMFVWKKATERKS
jgi:hypothetical protein